MFFVVGLGNPGAEYAQTRHNVGYLVVEELNDRHGGKFKKGRGPYALSKVVIKQTPLFLIKPLTFMNLSGRAVRHLIDFYQISDLSHLLIALDDFQLPFGAMRIRASGSAGGQKGLESILQILKNNSVPRLRIGIGNSFQNASSFVLSPFKSEEKKQLPDVINRAADAVEIWVTEGIDRAMQLYNSNAEN